MLLKPRQIKTMLTRSKSKKVKSDDKYVEHINTLHKIAEGLLDYSTNISDDKKREIIENYENIIRCLLNID
jgi:hypothetical protein